ncbi:MAG TPA: GDP-L-fucose synthase [Candidatus Obscuribacterales bacterium]
MFANKVIVVTGGSGFLGSHVVESLKGAGCEKVVIPRKRDFDLTQQADVRKLIKSHSPDIIIHLAASVGGIGANRDNPGKFFYENLLMGAMLMEEARLGNCEKMVVVGTICSYPKFAPIPFREEDLWSGYPEETNAPYGIAKKAILVQSQSYREQYGFNSIYLMPVNLYGPRDNFDLDSSHVIPALIRKFTEAKESAAREVVLWGDGSPTREFLYVEEAARGIVLATEKYNAPEPVNLGSGHEISIKELATLTGQLVGFEGGIKWDTTKPNGQPRRRLDVSRARDYFGFESKIDFREGLRKTIDWFNENRKAIYSREQLAVR